MVIASILGIVVFISIIYILFEMAHLLVESKFYIVEILECKNKLYQCRKCDKLFRKYQEELYVQAKGRNRNYDYCPHCETNSPYRVADEINKQPKWAKYHSDCPKISAWQHIKVKRTGRQLVKIRLSQEEQEFFEKYNDIKVDFSWLENLKDSGK